MMKFNAGNAGWNRLFREQVRLEYVSQCSELDFAWFQLVLYIFEQFLGSTVSFMKGKCRVAMMVPALRRRPGGHLPSDICRPC